MSEIQRARLKIMLAQHYVGEREEVPEDVVASLAKAMVQQSARAARVQRVRTNMAAFVAAQVRYIPVWVWVAQLALVALLVLVASGHNVTGAAVGWAIGSLSAIAVLAGAPVLNASRVHNVAELEYACAHNAASVVVARMIVLGCSCSLCVAVMIAAAAQAVNVSAFTIALWACPPYFVSCAGCLHALQRVRPPAAVPACTAWVFVCCALLLAAGNMFPQAYTEAALAVWAVAAAVAGVWLAREAAAVATAVHGGLELWKKEQQWN